MLLLFAASISALASELLLFFFSSANLAAASSFVVSFWSLASTAASSNLALSIALSISKLLNAVAACASLALFLRSSSFKVWPARISLDTSRLFLPNSFWYWSSALRSTIPAISNPVALSLPDLALSIIAARLSPPGSIGRPVSGSICIPALLALANILLNWSVAAFCRPVPTSRTSVPAPLNASDVSRPSVSLAVKLSFIALSASGLYSAALRLRSSAVSSKMFLAAIYALLD